MKHAYAQKVELGAAVHLTLEELEPVDLPLDLAAAPLGSEGRAHCGQISLEARCESTHFRHVAITGLGQPAIESVKVATVNQAKKVARQTASHSNRRFDFAQPFDEALLVKALAFGRSFPMPADQPCKGLP
ncbi:hypothetical protein QTI66_32345 [Variovorax sp. J22R133]|nr:hypothetical protein [Variovorax sp. J22R133]MDM0116823.1 hypothetical protein [Variovorax sp. J22R133]